MSEEKRPDTGGLGGAEIVVPCADLDAAIAYCTDELGFRLDMIMPADAPRVAVVSGSGVALRLVAGESASATQAPLLRIAKSSLPRGEPPPPFAGLRVEIFDDDAQLEIPEGHQTFVITRTADAQAWAAGRAGMHYRDLIPDRCGGRFIASYIRIADGSSVADYVHHHAIRFQVIYCRRGWVRVVYEDQGEPFVMEAGDCVLQPPGIRHRVLESSPGLEVIEIACPAEHETRRDHDLALPTLHTRPERDFAGQRFVRHIAAGARWRESADGRIAIRDTGIAQATRGLAAVRVLRFAPQEDWAPKPVARTHGGEFLFYVVLDGRAQLQSAAVGAHALEPDDAVLIPAGADYAIEAARCELLEIALPAAAADA